MAQYAMRRQPVEAEQWHPETNPLPGVVILTQNNVTGELGHSVPTHPDWQQYGGCLVQHIEPGDWVVTGGEGPYQSRWVEPAASFAFYYEPFVELPDTITETQGVK